MRCRSLGARVATATLASLSILLLSPADRAGAFTIQTIAITGEAANGTGGATYLAFGNTVLNASGEVAFTATLQGAGVDPSNDLGAFSGMPTAPGLVARRGSTAPGTGGADFQSMISPPNLNDAGQTAFRGFLTTGGSVTTSNNEGLWSEASGSLALVAREGDPAAGVPAGQNHASTLGLGGPAWNNAGQVAYHGSLVDGGTTTADNRALWAGAAASPSLVARKGNVAHGVGDGALYESFDTPLLNGSGSVAYRAFLDNGDAGIWSGAIAGPDLVVREGGAAAGVAGGEFSSFQSPDLNAGGRLAIRANLATGVGGVTASDNAGLWVGDSGGLLLVAREGDVAPDSGGATYTSFVSALLNISGLTAFRATTSAGSGVYLGDENGVSGIAHTGDVAPDTNLGLGDALFAALLSPVVNDNDQVAFLSFLSGTGVTTDNDEALYATDLIGQLELIVREGELFERRPGDFSLVEEIQLLSGPESLGDSMNAAGEGQITFWLSFADGGEGVFITQVPEPGSAALLALGLLGMALRRQGVAR